MFSMAVSATMRGVVLVDIVKERFISKIFEKERFISR